MIYILKINEISEISFKEIVKLAENYWVKVVILKNNFALIETLELIYNECSNLENNYYMANGIIKKDKTSFWFKTTIQKYLLNNDVDEPFFNKTYDKININHLGGHLRLLLDIHIAINLKKNIILSSFGCLPEIENNIKNMIDSSNYCPKIIEVTDSIRVIQKIGKERVELPKT